MLAGRASSLTTLAPGGSFSCVGAGGGGAKSRGKDQAGRRVVA